jgi:hypothetical protein
MISSILSFGYHPDFRIPFKKPKNQKAKGYTGLCLMNNGGYGNRERWWVSYFDIIVDPL